MEGRRKEISNETRKEIKKKEQIKAQDGKN